MADSIREMSQLSTNLTYNNSTKSNSTNSNHTTTASYVAALFYLHKRGISHAANGECLPSCMAYNTNKIQHTPNGGLKFIEISSLDRKPYISYIVKPNTIPAGIVIQKNKFKGFFSHVIHYLSKPLSSKMILKDYAARKDLSPEKIVKAIKKLEKTKNKYEQYLRFEKGCFTPGKTFSYNHHVLLNYKYAIAYCELQIRLLQLQEKKSNKTQEQICKEWLF